MCELVNSKCESRTWAADIRACQPYPMLVTGSAAGAAAGVAGGHQHVAQCCRYSKFHRLMTEVTNTLQGRVAALVPTLTTHTTHHSKPLTS
jgi:hypothetical protein